MGDLIKFPQRGTNPSPEKSTGGPQNADQVMTLARKRKKLLGGNSTLKETTAEGRPFLDGEHSLFGYDRVVVKNGEITILKSSKKEKPDLTLNQEVTLKGDSEGYVPSGHEDGDRAKIIEFAEPFRDGASDRIIYVTGGALSGWVKPSNIEAE
jgi:hypothetical protein